jgi:hypothetical protein
MNKDGTTYAVVNEYGGGYVGNLSEIEEWLNQENLCLGDCRFWKLGEEVSVRLEVY